MGEPIRRLLTAEEVVQEFGLPSTRTLRTMRQKGLPGFRLGKAFLYRADDIEQHIEKAEATGSNPVGCTTNPRVFTSCLSATLQSDAGIYAHKTGTRVQFSYSGFQRCETGGGMIAALYVEAGGSYFGLPDVDPWDEARDARQYAGPHPVVAHPPCQRWGDMWMGSPLVIARTGVRKTLGDDDGCFEHALKTVRQFGGVIEHPEGSRAWTYFGLNKPPREGGWVVADFEGGWTCRVEQVAYGHVVRKATWLYAAHCDLPSLAWGVDPRKLPSMVQPSKTRIAEGRTPSTSAHGVADRLRIHTPEPFRDLLLAIARTAKPERLAA